MKWISVKDRLPDSGAVSRYLSPLVLIYSKDDIGVGFYLFDSDDWKTKEFRDVSVTHWIELPPEPV